MCAPKRPPSELMVKASEIFEAARPVAVFTAERAEDARGVRIFMTADAPLNLDRAEALR